MKYSFNIAYPQALNRAVASPPSHYYKNVKTLRFLPNRCENPPRNCFAAGKMLRSSKKMRNPPSLGETYAWCDNGYAEARRILESEFGHPYKLAMVYVDQIVELPPVKPNDAQALRKLACFLKKMSLSVEWRSSNIASRPSKHSPLSG